MSIGDWSQAGGFSLARSFKILSFASEESPSQSSSRPSGAKSSASDVTSWNEPRRLVVASDAGVCGAAVVDIDNSGFFSTGEVDEAPSETAGFLLTAQLDEAPPDAAGFLLTGIFEVWAAGFFIAAAAKDYKEQAGIWSLYRQHKCISSYCTIFARTKAQQKISFKSRTDVDVCIHLCGTGT